MGEDWKSLRFAELIRKRRLDLGLRIEEVVEATGICNRTIYGYESGRRVPRIATWEVLDAYYNSFEAEGKVSNPLNVTSWKARKQYGMWLRKRRLDLGLRLREVAAAIGVHPQTLSLYEKALRAPRKAILEALNAYYSGIEAEGKVATSLDESLQAKKQFADRLQKRRWDLGLTIREVAAAIGVSRQAVCDYENGKCKPTLANMAALDAYYSRLEADAEVTDEV